jgi:branched-chain amino acid transport system substrate-binding protein
LIPVITSIVAAIAGAAAAAVFDRVKMPRGVPVRTIALVVGGAALGFAAAVLISLSLSSGPSLTIYSSLPKKNADGQPNKRTTDIENAIKLALTQNNRKAGKFTIKYERLDATDENGASPPQKIQDNARTAAEDDKTAVYIGDFRSSASIESIPILSRAGIPQISPNSTRVGLTVGDSLSDTDEPDRYYRGVARNFVRVIPNDDVQAAALSALMRKDGCDKVATIYDGSDYSQGLSVLMRLANGPKRSFSEDVRPKERGKRYGELAETARRRRVDCFLYMGTDNPNTFGIFEAFADKLPDATLYGTDGVSESSLMDANGDLPKFATRVKLMVPPRDLCRYKGFREDFESEYDGAVPDPDAIYGYEAMKLALDAIKESGSGTEDPGAERGGPPPTQEVGGRRGARGVSAESPSPPASEAAGHVLRHVQLRHAQATAAARDRLCGFGR